MILGHHAHILKGIEVYEGKVIFYSLSNFAFDKTAPPTPHALTLNPTWKNDPDYAGYVFPADSRKTILAKCMVSGKKIQWVSFLPVYIDGQARPSVLRHDEARFDEVVEYVKTISADQGLLTKFVRDGDEIVVTS